MKRELYSRVALCKDLELEGLRCGDVATIIECDDVPPGQAAGYGLEVFNAIGETIVVVTVQESQIEAFRRDEILSVRPLAAV